MTPEEMCTVHRAVCIYYDEPSLMVMGPRRCTKYVHPRWAAFVAMWSLGATKSAIATFYGRDHSAVCYALRKSIALVAHDDLFRGAIRAAMQSAAERAAA